MSRFPGPFGRLVDLLLLPRWQSPDQGVQTAIDLTLSERFEGLTGCFFWRNRKRRLPPRFASEGTAALLRERTGILLANTAVSRADY
ncbi:MAG: hypothetical protein WCL50_04830 [Spirochaetota bacterium]